MGVPLNYTLHMIPYYCSACTNPFASGVKVGFKICRFWYTPISPFVLEHVFGTLVSDQPCEGGSLSLQSTI